VSPSALTAQSDRTDPTPNITHVPVVGFGPGGKAHLYRLSQRSVGVHGSPICPHGESPVVPLSEPLSEPVPEDVPESVPGSVVVPLVPLAVESSLDRRPQPDINRINISQRDFSELRAEKAACRASKAGLRHL
jgi:hypothetical protein